MVGGDEPIEDGEENTRKAPVDEITQRSKASPRGISGNMHERSDRLSRVNKMDIARRQLLSMSQALKRTYA